MARPLSVRKVLSALRAEGLNLREVGHWRKHNRSHRGPWGPVHGVMLHHTGRYSSAEQIVQLCYDGHSTLPGPLCMGVIDKRGVVHLVGYGRGNHAGLGDVDVLRAVTNESGLPEPHRLDTDGNRHFYGFECVNRGDGVDPWTPAQLEAMVRVSAALLRGHKWGRCGKTSVIAHREWQQGKPDPRGHNFPGMDGLRDRVAVRLEHEPGWSPNGTGSGTYRVKEGDTLWSVATAHRMKWRRLWEANEETVPNPDVIKPGQVLRLR